MGTGRLNESRSTKGLSQPNKSRGKTHSQFKSWSHLKTQPRLGSYELFALLQCVRCGYDGIIMEMRNINRKLLILAIILPVGCLAGLIFGLVVGRQLLPVEYINTEIGNFNTDQVFLYLLVDYKL